MRTRWTPGTGLLITGIIVATRHWRLFGYERRRQHGPALLWWLIRRIHRHTRYATAGEFDRDDDAGAIRLRKRYADLPRLVADR
ncbi:hypothetical protein ACFQ3B_15625 [Stackebrandtia endophytica]|uniref:hypothetical protein n=1 Tax=Stackebrandtia endophytica TaxID=1496996 RepID=UPI0011525AA0|nr:hypothetical protein [Stackebrandtia endophytica]